MRNIKAQHYIEQQSYFELNKNIENHFLLLTQYGD